MAESDIHVEFDVEGVRDMSSQIADAVTLFGQVEGDLDASMQQLKNAAFKGIVGDDVLNSYETVVKERIQDLVKRATELSDDLDRIANMMEQYGQT